MRNTNQTEITRITLHYNNRFPFFEENSVREYELTSFDFVSYR